MPKLGLGLSLANPRIAGGGGGGFSPANIPGLLAFYNFEAIDSTLPDLSGNGNDLIAYPFSELWSVSTGVVLNAIRFEAYPFNDMSSGDRFGSTIFAIDPNSDFSLSVWMKPRSFDSYSHMIGAPFQNGLYVGGTDTNLKFSLFNGTVFGVEAPTVTPDTWHHYVFRRSGDTLLLTADNVPAGSISVTGETFTGAPVFSVGGGEYDQYYYDGDLDALGLWDNAISDANIAELWNGGAGVQMP